MNIIKLKDKIMPGDSPLALYFNKNLRGKYAYWIQMRYIVSFDAIGYDQYVYLENTQKDIEGIDYIIDIYDYVTCEGESIVDYIDSEETDRINNINDLILKNNYVPDNDITIDELKKFRTWVATQLLLMDTNNKGESIGILFDSADIKMLTYYKQGMYDDVIESLTDFAVNSVTLSTEPILKKTCGCCSHGDTLASFTEVSTCDPVAMYRRGIYNHMVKRFADIPFWLRYDTDFLVEMKIYVDNIIKLNFPLVKSQYISDFVDCGCDVSDPQNIEMQKLKNFSTALGYIINNEQAGHKNFINDAFLVWAKDLYEMMEW